jgi:hypothetical protein
MALAARIHQPVLHRFVTWARSLRLETVDKLLPYFDLEVRPRARGRTRKEAGP